MSLIFRALQQVGDHASAAQAAPHDSVPNKKRISFSLRAFLSSNVTVLIAAVGIFLAGLFISQAIHFFPDRLMAQPPLAEAALNHPAPTAAAESNPEPSAGKTVASGDADQIASEDPENVKYQVHAPESPATAIPLVTAEANRFSQMPGEPAGMNNDMISPSSPPSAGIPIETAAAIPDKSAIDKATDIGRWDSRKNQNTAYPSPMLGMVPPDTVPPPRPGKRFRYRLEPGENESAVPGDDPQRQRISAQTKRHLEISKLANKIYSAIQADDTELTSRLIGQLSKLKGSHNNFVLKLKAYTLIRQNRFDEARTVLSRVLSRRADDLEAGLNIAVVDIRTGHYQNARRRLLHLQGLYPEKDDVTQMLKQLPSSP